MLKLNTVESDYIDPANYSALKIVIVGPGRVGLSLAGVAMKSSMQVAAIGSRRADKFKDKDSPISFGNIRCLDVNSAVKLGDVIFLTVPDRAVESLCAELAHRKIFKRGSIVLHTSGALSSDALQMASRECGCHIASFHPLLSLSDPSLSMKMLSEAYVFCEGDDPAFAFCVYFCQKIGANCLKIDKNVKKMYHAAAVCGSNYIVTLMNYSVRLLKEAGIEGGVAEHALKVLVDSTLNNVGERGVRYALTGPIERGDIITVASHLDEIIRKCPEQLEFYKFMAKQTCSLALKKGSITNETAAELLLILNKHREL